MNEKKGFWSCLFDLSFSELIIMRVIKVLYAIGILIAGIVGFILIVKAFGQGFGTGLLLVIAAPIAFILLVIIARVNMELLLTLFRIEENTRKPTDTAQEASAPGGAEEPESAE